MPMEEHYSQHMTIVQKVVELEKADPTLHQSQAAMVAEIRAVMVAENQAAMLVENQAVMVAEIRAAVLVESRAAMLDTRAARMVVVPAEKARGPDQVHTWDINAEREPLQRHNVDKNVETPVP